MLKSRNETGWTLRVTSPANNVQQDKEVKQIWSQFDQNAKRSASDVLPNMNHI